MPTTTTTTTTTSTTTTEALLAALGSGPASAAEVAEAAGIGRSTATKVLAALAVGGQVERTPGGRDGARRMPDRWSLPAPAEDPARPAGDGGEPQGTASPRLGKGELAAMALAFLRNNAGEHSPSAVARALGGRSAGAVGNALGRLVASGDATQTSDRPRRYRAATR
jgi:predicted ArsR family transcriptional regulator